MTLLGQLARSGKVNVAADAKAFVLDVESSRTDKQLGQIPGAQYYVTGGERRHPDGN
jgi:hypothetical protein